MKSTDESGKPITTLSFSRMKVYTSNFSSPLAWNGGSWLHQGGNEAPTAYWPSFQFIWVLLYG